MKALLLPLAAVAALAGCATYGDPYGHGYGYPSTSVYPAATVYQGVPGSYATPYGTYAYPQGTQGTRGMRDRDGDGIPNRMDNDRDGDGVPNEYDARPNNPRYR